MTPHIFCSYLPQIEQNNHAMYRFQHLACVDFKQPCALDSQNTAPSLQLTAFHCMIHNQHLILKCNDYNIFRRLSC